MSNTTAVWQPFAEAMIAQDGYASGELTGRNVSKDGTLMASYSNGLTRPEGTGGPGPLYQPARAGPQRQQQLGADQRLLARCCTAQPVRAALARFTGCALEESNVDLTAELVGMMTAQRFYQANAQTIKTQDQVFSTLVNLR